SFGSIHTTCLSALVTDRPLKAWYNPNCMNDPQPEGSHGKLHQTTKILSHASRRRGDGMAARRSCAVDDPANSSDDSEPAADRGGAREAYRPGGPKASVSIKRWVS